MKLLYSRISSIEQNPERQLVDSKLYDYVLTDYCSGSIPLYDRPQGSQIRKLVEQGKVREIHIHSIDRLGRDLISTLSVWNELTQKGVIIHCKNPNIRNIDENGKIDKFSELMMSILSTMSSFERTLIKERQMEGIKIRKEKGLYGGRVIGSIESPEQLLKKGRSKKILEYINKGYSYDNISKIIPCSKTTIVKVKKVSELVLN